MAMQTMGMLLVIVIDYGLDYCFPPLGQCGTSSSCMALFEATEFPFSYAAFIRVKVGW